MLIIPAIDLIDEKVVRLKKGKAETAEFFSESIESLIGRVPQELRRLHVVNLSGAFDPRSSIPQRTLRLLTQRFDVQFGGGLREADQLDLLKEIGVQRIVIGTLWFENWHLANELAQTWGASRVVASVDVGSYQDQTVKTKGWTENTGRSLDDHLEKLSDHGITEYLITSISQDGLMQGPDCRLYESVRQRFPNIYIIGSGGFRGPEDIQGLAKVGCNACVVGKAWLSNVNFFGELHA